MLMRAAIAPTPASPSSRPFAKGTGDAHTIAGVMGMMGARMSYARNVEIFGEGEPAEYIYKVVSGAVRSCRVKPLLTTTDVATAAKSVGKG
jgi:CRP/FNR family transcriptional regulator, nitrogen fixation regulation protein